eukprot:jgi/Chrzof1/13007/Cz07g16070.t1
MQEVSNGASVSLTGTPAKGREPDKSNATDWEAQGPLKRLKLTYDEASGHHFMHYDANAANTIEQHEAQPTAHQQPTSSASHNKKPVYTDEHTAFVKGIGTGVSQEQLVQLFAPCGGLKSIRLAVTDHGKSRGYAYVEFEADQGVLNAISLNGTVLHGKPLFIAKSQPPASQHRHDKGHVPHPAVPKVHVSGARGNMGHPRHAVQLDAPHTGAQQHAMDVDVADDHAAPAAGGSTLSNDDFRRMLLGQKQQ